MDNEEVHVYCHMTNDLMGCGGDGWTLVMKMNGTKVSCLLSYKGEKKTLISSLKGSIRLRSEVDHKRNFKA